MLGDREAIATIAVKDINVAKKFYEGALGLKPKPSDEPSVLEYKTGNSSLYVYKSEYAGTNQATAVTWGVADMEDEVKKLKGKGVAFEHYDMPGLTLKGDVHVSGKMKAAWFKDPDGNIIALVGGS